MFKTLFRYLYFDCEVLNYVKYSIIKSDSWLSDILFKTIYGASLIFSTFVCFLPIFYIQQNLIFHIYKNSNGKKYCLHI